MANKICIRKRDAQSLKVKKKKKKDYNKQLISICLRYNR